MESVPQQTQSSTSSIITTLRSLRLPIPFSGGIDVAVFDIIASVIALALIAGWFGFPDILVHWLQFLLVLLFIMLLTLTLH